MPAPTRLIIFAPARLLREAWRALLSAQPDILVAGTVGEASGVAGLLESSDQPTTILVDQPTPQPDTRAGAGMARDLRLQAREAGLLFLVQSYDLADVLPLLQAGATGCISRDASVGDLARAIIAVGRGEIALPPDVAGRALAALARGETIGERLIEPLSDREVDVLRLLAHGLTNKDIAQTLFISVRTVEAHLRNIYGKLGARSRTEAALWAVKHGYSLKE
ncbi:MAG: DNA-binding response regulator [Anaerolineae bacterium]